MVGKIKCLAHSDIQIKHDAGKHLNLSDYLSRNSISKLEPIENYDEEYVFNCIIPLLELINTHDRITEERKYSMNGSNEATPNKQTIKFKTRANATDER